MSEDRAEQAFRTALANRATEYQPRTMDLPSPQRGRRWTAMLVAAVLIVAAILVGAFRPHGHQEVPSPAGLPTGWRWESYRDVMVGVPDTWGYAIAPAQGGWCAGEAYPPAQGYVDTANAYSSSTLVLCGGTPPAQAFAPHLSFVEGRSNALALPSDWTTRARSFGAVRVEVTVRKSQTFVAAAILATAHAVSEDQNGCAVSSPIQDQLVGRPSPPFDVSSVHRLDSIAVCQYKLDVSGPGLLASQLLTGGSAQAELAAIQGAAVRSGPDRGHGCSPADRGETGISLILKTGSRTHEMYAFYSGCTRNGFDDGTNIRELTTDNCPTLFDPRIVETEGIRRAFERCTAPEKH